MILFSKVAILKNCRKPSLSIALQSFRAGNPYPFEDTPKIERPTAALSTAPWEERKFLFLAFIYVLKGVSIRPSNRC